MSYTEHRLDIYGTALFLATTKKQWKALAKRIDALEKAKPDAAGQVTTFTRYPKKRGNTELVITVWIDTRNHTDPGELIDTCAHEASHAAGRILEHAGHTVPATDEPHAYLTGWITRWIWEHSGDDE
jgi:hypothetical protein